MELDITNVFSTLVLNLTYAFAWLQTHYIRLGTARISFFALGLSLLFIDIIISALVAWSGGIDDDDD